MIHDVFVPHTHTTNCHTASLRKLPDNWSSYPRIIVTTQQINATQWKRVTSIT